VANKINFVGSDSKNTEAREQLVDKLTKYFQSGHLNFLIGSGASSIAIVLATDIEKSLDTLYSSGCDVRAREIETQFIADLETHAENLNQNELDKKYEKNLEHYVSLISRLAEILKNRSSSLFTKQINIFTTNYDLFFEKASEAVPQIIFNDGFERTARLDRQFEFNPQNFFKRTLFTTSTYG
jgi:hypothetical protein